MINWHYVSDSIKGTKREKNKDRVLVAEDEKHMLAVLFDGISSAKEADEGIDIAINFIKQNHQKLDQEKDYNLGDLMFDANHKIAESNLISPFSTYSAICIPKAGGSAVFSSLGDSRIYVITSQYAKQLSHDDNLIHNKNIVTKYLGMVQLSRLQIEDFSLDITGKKILLCSDGFYSSLESNLSKFHKIFNFKRPWSIKNGLRREVKDKNFDDSSYILIF